MLKKILTTIFLVVMVLAVIGCGGKTETKTEQPNPEEIKTTASVPAKEEPKKTYIIKMGHVLDAKSHYQKFSDKFKELAEKNSNGQLKVETYPAGQLGGERDIVEGLRYNSIQAALSGGVIPNIEPKFAVVDLPFIFKDKADARGKLNGPLGDRLFDLLPQYGIIGIVWAENGFRNVTNSVKPIKTPADLKGLKIRTPENKIYLSTFKALGANPTPIPFPELYTALEQKVVSGQENPIPLILSSKFQEVQKHMTYTNHFYGSAPMLMSKQFYESLPADLQKVIEDAADEAVKFQSNYIDEQEGKMVAELEAAGMQIVKEINTEGFKALVKPVYDEYKDVIGPELMDLATK